MQREYEVDGSTHPSVVVNGHTIHIIHTGKATASYHDGLTILTATVF